MVDDIPTTYGALLIGGLFAFFLSGASTLQSFFYFKFYTSDLPRIKAFVVAIWVLDLMHTNFIAFTLWHYLVAYFGVRDRIDTVPWCLPMTVLITAALTLLVHCFYAHRIHKVSKKKWYLTAPVVCLAVSRFGAALFSTAELMRIGTISGFVSKYPWAFTIGLSVSSMIDIIITYILCYFLFKSRKASPSMHRIIDTLILYTFETGALTCSGTIVTLICWLAMPTNLIFVGLHFAISKLYSNSLLATLNTRKSVRNNKAFSMISLPVPGSMTASRHRMLPTLSYQSPRLFSPPPSRDGSIQVNVEQTVEYKVDSQTGVHKRSRSTTLSALPRAVNHFL